MDRLVGECQFSALEKVQYGPGSVARLEDELARMNISRAIVVTGKSLGASSIVDKVVAAMGGRCAGIFRGCQAHVPAPTVRALVAEMQASEADGVVSFGGGSPIDTAKAAVASLLNGCDITLKTSLRFYSLDREETPGKPLPHIAIPTTLSAAEYKPGAGVTDANGVKGGIQDSRLQPRVVINDAELTQATNWDLWASTGIRAIDHAVEAIYSSHSQSFTDALAANALRLMVRHLPLSSPESSASDWINHRQHCLTAGWLSTYANVNARGGVSHAVGHKIGPRWKIPHGITSCIALPHSMRLVANEKPDHFDLIAQVLGISGGSQRQRALRCADTIEALIADLGLARSLRDYDVAKQDFGDMSGLIQFEINDNNSLGQQVSKDQVADLLARCW